MLLTDTHCHLDMHQYDDDRDAVIMRAIDGGVTRMLIPGIDLQSSRAAVELAEKFSQVYAAVGVHPNSANSWTADTLEELKELCKHPKVVAVGEIGLDYFRDASPRYKQEQIFHYQLELALDLALPIIVHNREAMQDVLRMITEWYDTVMESGSLLVDRPGVLHSYSGTIDDVKSAIMAGFFFGVTGPVTFKKADDLREVFQRIDMNRILIETDSPYLSPEPKRGKRNEPINVTHIVEKVATIRAMKLDELITTTYNNAERLFQW